MLRWKKLGQVYRTNMPHGNAWMQQFAQCPTAFILNESTIRVFISSRPKPDSSLKYVSYPSYVDLDRHNILDVIGFAEAPILELGDRGTFDEFGIMPSSIIDQDGKFFLYYTGWTRLASLPYTLAIGMATSNDHGHNFKRIGAGPILNISLHEPYFVTGPSVIKNGKDWRMWYLSCVKWLFVEEKYEPVYQLAMAKSTDGISWKSIQKKIMPTLSENECQDIFTPFFYRGKWHALFAWRTACGSDGNYRIGYAHSEDLETWIRNDSLAGISTSEDGWDSEMICYLHIKEIDGRILMFYCGNSFGKDGFGIAELINE